MRIVEKINQLQYEHQELSRLIRELHVQRRKTKKKLEKLQRDLKFLLSQNQKPLIFNRAS